MGTQLPRPKRGHSPQFSADVCCGQTAGLIKMPPGTKVGVSPGDIVLIGDPAPPKKRTDPQFSAHVCCGQMAGLIKVPLGTEVDIGPGHIVLHGDPALPPPKKGGTAPSNFRPMSIVAKRSPIWATALFFNFVSFTSPLARPCCLVLLRLLLRVLMCSVSGRMSRPSDKRRRRRPLLGGPQRGGGHVSKTAARRR